MVTCHTFKKKKKEISKEEYGEEYGNVWKNMEAIISIKNQGSRETDIDETTTDSVNNEHTNFSIVVNEVWNTNQDLLITLTYLLKITITEKLISVPTNCKEQNTQEDFTEKKSEKNQPKYLTMELFCYFLWWLYWI